MSESQNNQPEKSKHFWGLSLKKKLLDYPFSRYIWHYRKRYFWGLLTLMGVDFLNVVQPLLVKEAIDALIPKDSHRVVVASLLFFIVMCLQSVGRYWWRMFLIGTANRVSADLRLELYQHLQRLPLTRYQKIRTGDLMSRATNDVESIRMALGPGILVSLDAAILFLMLVPAMLWLSWKLTLLTFAFYPLVPWLTAKVGNKIDDISGNLQARMSQMSAFAQETFSGIRLIKSLTLEGRSLERFKELSSAYVADGTVLSKYEALFSPALGFITSLGTLLILLFGGKQVIAGAITVGTFIAFQRFVVQLSWPMEAIGWAVTMTREAKAAERRLEDLLQAEVAPNILPVSATGDFESLLEIEKLQFGYPVDGTQGFTLDLSGLKIKPGQKVGLVGPVGSGKSTLFQLLLRLYEPPSATIFLRGHDIKGIDVVTLRSRIASVEQQVFLFSETLETNISLGMKNPPDRNTVRVAAEASSLLNEIDQLEKGFDTLLGERGLNLSGGQKQRLALVRAIVRRPELLLLDDSFSAVDVESEQRIIESLFADYPQMGLLFASHRLSVMTRMDEIWLIDKGRVVGRGSHSELIRSSALYQSLWQKSEKEVEREKFEGVVAEVQA